MIGGSELALEEMTRRLPDIFFDIITPKYGREFKSLELGANFSVHRIGPVSGLAKIFFPVSGFLKARRLMKVSRYNAVHAYQASYGGGAAWLLKTLYPKLPFILTMQEGKKLNAQPLILNWLRRMIIKKADAVTVISRYLENFVRGTASDKKIHLIPNGVDLEKFQIPSHKLQTTLKFQDQNYQTIISVSRLVPKNGLSDLIRAFNIFNEYYELQATSYKLLIIGDGPQREELFGLTKELGLEDKIVFAGNIPNENVHEYLASSSVFVRPSLSEGLGTAFLEAMAAGVPVIGTATGGIPDFLKNGETGLFCNIGDPQDIADKIKMILMDDELRNRLILNARKFVEEHYDWNKIAAKFRNLYATI